MIRAGMCMFLVLACLVPYGQAILDPSEVDVGEGGSIADTLLNYSSEGGKIVSGDPRFPKTPHESRAIQENRTGKDWTMPSTLSQGATTARSSRAEAESSASSAEPSETEAPPAEVVTTSMEGSWLFYLNDTISRQLALALFQRDEHVFGAGNLREGNSTLQVAASGSVQGDLMQLSIVSLGSISLYALDLRLSDDAASGDYRAFSAAGDSWKGSADGMRLSSE